MAAAKTTRLMAAFSMAGSTLAETPSSTVGIGGNSLASAPWMVALLSPQESFKTPEPGSNSISIFLLGKELTNSVNSLAGTVIVPSSSTMAPIQVVMAISRFVADSFSIE